MPVYLDNVHAEVEAELAEQRAMIAGEELPFEYVVATDGLVAHLIEARGSNLFQLLVQHITGPLTVKDVLLAVAKNNGYDPERFAGSEPERGLESAVYFLRETHGH